MGVLISLIIANRRLSTDVISATLKSSSGRAGRILLDLCGAGALGSIIAHSDFSDGVLGLLGSSSVPVMLFPFLLAMCIQTAQGSRVVTAIVTAGIVKDLACMQTVFMICAGTFIFSYVSDPYFWLVKQDSSMKDNLKYYTLPLALAGAVVLLCAILFL
jgi:GntP family gluconate:H+ symporter